ncbi:TPA: hypothetical protein ACITN2_004658 [Salmonella enterica subsp. enterica serovar Virchow]
MKKAACFILLTLCASAQAHPPAELQYQQDQLKLANALNRCNDMAAVQRSDAQKNTRYYLPTFLPADVVEAARKAPPLSREICWQNYARKSAELKARQPQEIKDENARITREAKAQSDALNAEAIR